VCLGYTQVKHILLCIWDISYSFNIFVCTCSPTSDKESHPKHQNSVHLGGEVAAYKRSRV